MDFLCRKCNGRGFYLQEKGPNVGMYCDCCGAWAKWVGKKELPLMRRQGYSVLPGSAVVTLKNQKDLGIDLANNKPMDLGGVPTDLGTMPFGGEPAKEKKEMSFAAMEDEIERRVAERMKELERNQMMTNQESISNKQSEPTVDEGYCPVCEGNPLESEGNSRVEVSIFSGVMTITDPDGLNIFGLYKLKRCPFCGKLF